MISLSIDIGNTRIKAGVFENGILQSVFRFEDLGGLTLYCRDLPLNTPLIISSVTNDDLSPFHQNNQRVHILNHKTPLPISNLYQTPETLGNDRLAAVVGAYALHPGQHNLVIDLGTCFKYDFVNADGKYFGGSISPGLDLKIKSLHHFTGRLPLIEKSHLLERAGDTTEKALLSGVMFGSLLEIQGFINDYSKAYNPLNVILTGGDASYFSERLKGAIFAEPDLVLKGLFEILKYNAFNA